VIGGLLLDLDGTLVLSEDAHRQTWQHFFDTWGVEVDDEKYQSTFMGRRAGDVLAAEPGPWSGHDLDAITEKMVAHASTLGHMVAPVPGAAALIRRAAAAGMPIAVVTSARRGWAGEVLGRVLGVRDLLSGLVTAEDVTTGKPSPEGYLRGCELLGVPPARCLGIEDSSSGIQALLDAGVEHVVGITTTSPAEDLLAAGARRTVDDLADGALVELVGRR
jgi:sugar-phosphatase